MGNRLKAATMARRGVAGPHSLVMIDAPGDGGGHLLSLIGDLDLAAAPRFVVQARDALRRGPRRLLVELSGVTFIDSAGLAALLNVLRRASASDAKLVIVGAQPQVARTFAQSRLDRQFSFAATVADAERL